MQFLGELFLGQAEVVKHETHDIGVGRREAGLAELGVGAMYELFDWNAHQASADRQPRFPLFR